MDFLHLIHRICPQDASNLPPLRRPTLHLGENQRQLQPGNQVARRLRLRELHLGSLRLAGYVYFRSDFKEVLFYSVQWLVTGEQEVGDLDVLF
jgi:hypothetical protein